MSQKAEREYPNEQNQKQKRNMTRDTEEIQESSDHTSKPCMPQKWKI